MLFVQQQGVLLNSPTLLLFAVVPGCSGQCVGLVVVVHLVRMLGTFVRFVLVGACVRACTVSKQMEQTRGWSHCQCAWGCVWFCKCVLVPVLQQLFNVACVIGFRRGCSGQPICTVGLISDRCAPCGVVAQAGCRFETIMWCLGADYVRPGLPVGASMFQ